jgi:hypothetical protein
MATSVPQMVQCSWNHLKAINISGLEKREALASRFLDHCASLQGSGLWAADSGLAVDAQGKQRISFIPLKSTCTAAGVGRFSAARPGTAGCQGGRWGCEPKGGCADDRQQAEYSATSTDVSGHEHRLCSVAADLEAGRGKTTDGVADDISGTARMVPATRSRGGLPSI